MAHRVFCYECIFKYPCKNNSIKGCPCKECLIKMVCTNTCKEADIFFHKTNKFLKKARSQ